MPQLQQRSDAELVEQCNTGSRDVAAKAFEVLYARHKDYVVRVAYRYLRDADLVLDVLQETFTYLLKRFPPPGDGLTLDAKLQTLLYTVAKNSALSVLRKNNRADVASERDPDEFAAADTPDSEIGQLLSGLSPTQREIVALRFIDDMSLADIAKALDVPLGTVKSRLHTSISALRNSPYVKAYFNK